MNRLNDKWPINRLTDYSNYRLYSLDIGSGFGFHNQNPYRKFTLDAPGIKVLNRVINPGANPKNGWGGWGGA